MSLFHSAAARLLAMPALTTLTLATATNAQIDGQSQGLAPDQGGGMMDGGWGWGMGNGSYGMGGFGGAGILVLALVVIAIAALALRRRKP